MTYKVIEAFSLRDSYFFVNIHIRGTVQQG